MGDEKGRLTLVTAQAFGREWPQREPQPRESKPEPGTWACRGKRNAAADSRVV